MRVLLTALFFFLLSFSAQAVLPDEMLADPVLETRAREISRGLRCLVCQGEDIDESNAELAGDLRRLVRARIVAGDSNEQVFEYLQARYGDYVLMKPPLAVHTAVLWFLPAGIFGAGLAVVYLALRRRKRGA